MTAPTTSVSPFASARDMLALLRERQVSAEDLLQLHLDRIEKYNPELNVIVTPDFERARQRARESDRRIAEGEAGALEGIPITIKDSNQVAGLRATAGLKALADFVPETDGLLAQRLFAAGANLIGKTNVPPSLSDWQANNPIFGRTVNPWDHSRTPGGSTGGSAALAAGLTPLEFGSDIGGSIRVPAAFCGLFGHRPSETALPRTGAMPPYFPSSPLGMMGVQGPLARSARDLELAMDVIAGPEQFEDTGAWKLELPPPRHRRLGDFRVAVFPELDFIPVSREVRAALGQVVDILRGAGATIGIAAPEGVDSEEHFDNYNSLLQIMMSAGMDPEERRALGERTREGDTARVRAISRGLLATIDDFRQITGARSRSRLAYREFFKQWDVLLSPITLIPAFEHDDSPQGERTIIVDEAHVDYYLQIFYPSIATFPGQPATAFPVTRSSEGLPIGLQAIGPYLEDRTPIEFAHLLEQELGGFVAPPRYAV